MSNLEFAYGVCNQGISDCVGIKQCGAVASDDLEPWTCTRPKGHTGDHIACDYAGQENISLHHGYRWAQDKELPCEGDCLPRVSDWCNVVIKPDCLCSRPKFHEGEHIACASSEGSTDPEDHNLSRSPNNHEYELSVLNCLPRKP